MYNDTKFKQFKIKASYKGNKKASWGDNWNNYMITVTNTETDQKSLLNFGQV